MDIETGMQRLVELVALLPQALGYPIGSFASVIDLLTPSIRDHPLYRHVCDGLDKAIMRQEGEAAVADKCRQRATALDAAGRPLDALHEFHQAKINWFHGDTLSVAMRAIAAIADIYANMGMFLAAKKHALGLAAIAYASLDPSDRISLPIALFAASDYDHRAGAWISSAEVASLASLAHVAYAPNPEDLNWHSHVAHAANNQSLTTLIAHQLRPSFKASILEILETGHLIDLVQTNVDSLVAASSCRSEQEWLACLPDMNGLPFSDTGPQRIITFRACGVRWNIHGSNDRKTVIALEDFTSTLQILLVEVASLDAVIVPLNVDVEIRAYGPGPRPADTYMTREQRDERQWLLFMPADPQREPSDEISHNTLMLAFQVLLGNSLLDKESFSDLMDRAAENGLFHKLEIGRPYHELATFDSSSHPLTGSEHQPFTSSDGRHPNGSSHLAMLTRPGPGYSTEKAHEILAERYQLLPIPIRYTLRDLLEDAEVRALFQELREEGWKDWHLLNVVLNLTLSHRIAERHGPLTMEAAQRLHEQILDEAYRAEQPDDPRISPAAISREAMESSISMLATATLRRWNLALHHGTSNPSVVMKLLEQRYGFFEDDIPHSDLFDSQLLPGPNRSDARSGTSQ